MILPTRAAIVAMMAGCALGVQAEPLEMPAPEGVSEQAHDRAFSMIQMQTFYSLPESHRAEILAAAEREGIELPMTSQDLVQTHPEVIERSQPLSAEEADEAFAKVQHVVDRDTFDTFKPIHQRMIASFAELTKTHEVAVSPCFVPGTDPALVQAFEDIVFGDFSRFQLTGRWQSTALNPGGASQGDPTILTYSFPADGVNIPNGVGEGAGPNDLNAFMDGIYGDRATWRAIYDDIFARWGELSGNTYVLEPNDDNVTLFNSPGVAGVRGDLRMGAKPIDGNSGTLAYNFFPQNGDMVLDSADNFYDNTFGNSIRLRNILWHEHGHGMGLLHVCPLGSILMNPFINTGFDGPQYDDVLGSQRQYGDAFEPNDSQGQATDLGTFSQGQTFNIGGFGAVGPNTVEWVSVDDNGDTDFYRVQVTGSVSITATATPIGFSYQDGPQTGPCNTGPTVNPTNNADLEIAILNSAGTVLASVDDTGLGSAETAVANAANGEFFVRVRNGGQNAIQAYRFDLLVGAPEVIPPSLAFEPFAPSTIMPGEASDLNFVLLNDNGDTIIDGPTLNVRDASEPTFTQIAMTEVAPGTFQYVIPAFDCGDSPEFFISVEGQQGGVVTLPEVGTQPLVVASDSLEIDADDGTGLIAFAVSGNIASDLSGQWESGGVQGNDRSDPPVDFDGNGQAWLTGINADINTDVDGGSTILTSPVYDMSQGGSVDFAYWANDETNTVDEATDGLDVEVSTDGGSSWAAVRDYDMATTWRTDTLTAGIDFGFSSQFRFRFIATEAGQGDVFEAGVDAVSVNQATCEDPADPCTNPADVNGDNVIDGGDFFAWVNAFSNNEPGCDQNGDGSCEGSDFFAWVANFGDGC